MNYRKNMLRLMRKRVKFEVNSIGNNLEKIQ